MKNSVESFRDDKVQAGVDKASGKKWNIGSKTKVQYEYTGSALFEPE